MDTEKWKCNDRGTEMEIDMKRSGNAIEKIIKHEKTKIWKRNWKAKKEVETKWT